MTRRRPDRGVKALLLLGLTAGTSGCRSGAPDQPPAELARPQVAPARRFVPPAVEEGRLDNGLVVSLVRRTSVPALWLQFVFEGGEAADPDGQVGLAATCMDLLSDGPASLERDAYVARMRATGTGISFASEARQYVGYVTTLRSQVDGALALFADTVMRPALRFQDLKRIVSARTQTLEGAATDPFQTADRLLARVAFGDDHPAGRLPRAEGLRGIGIGDCKRLVAQRLKPQRARLLVVGDITLPLLLKRLAAHLGAWQGAPLPAPRPAVVAPPSSRLILVDQPKAPGVLIVAIYRSATSAEGGSDVAASLVATEVLGTLRGRLDRFTYDVHPLSRRFGGRDLRAFSFQTDPQTVGQTLDATARAFATVRGQPLAELNRPALKQGVMFETISKLDTGAGLLALYAGPVRAGLPPESARQMPERLASMSEQALGQALRDIAADKVQFLVIGEASVSLPQVRSFVGRPDGPGSMAVWTELGDYEMGLGARP